LPRNLDEFSQAIKQTKQSIYNDYTAIAREAGKETSVDTSNIVKDLKSQLKNKE
jgi:gas vesicle protein